MDELHSTPQEKEDEDSLSPAIRSAVAELRAKYPAQAAPVLKWNDNYVAVPLAVDVELPGRGPVGGVDIRKREPLLLLFPIRSFPYLAPRVYSDRRDFSKAFPTSIRRAPSCRRRSAYIAVRSTPGSRSTR